MAGAAPDQQRFDERNWLTPIRRYSVRFHGRYFILPTLGISGF
jgi:hypothetical protein